ncbi:MAG: hypothetical protein GC154_15430 [bacterium]|nr:hypothetical protein [bacterium]
MNNRKRTFISFVSSATLAIVLCFTCCIDAASAPVKWKHLTSKNGDLPVPGKSTQQTGALIGDFDGDGVNDFIISCRQVAPALVWFRRVDDGWKRIVIENEYLTVEAGGAAYDIDGDGDLDVVFGGDWQSDQLWWWENPSPDFNPDISWKRRIIKQGGAHQHHDQAFGDFLGNGGMQLAFWNQQAKKLFLAEIPENPREAKSWLLTEVFSGAESEKLPYAEGMSACDVDGDGIQDILGVSYWFKYEGDGKFKAVYLGSPGGLIFGGDLIEGGCPEIVISPGDGSGPVKLYECKGDPMKTESWQARDLIGRDVIHGHSLQLGDVDGDGHLDIFMAEMAKWSNKPEPDNPNATAFILYGDGKGEFNKTELIKGHGWHEARLADLDGDGDLDILNKPYTWETPRLDVWINQGQQ